MKKLNILIIASIICLTYSCVATQELPNDKYKVLEIHKYSTKVLNIRTNKTITLPERLTEVKEGQLVYITVDKETNPLFTSLF